jgi:linoleoyl-CoA desaturase
MFDGFVWILKNPKETRIDQLVLPGYFLLYFVLPVPWIGFKLALIHWLVDSALASLYIALTFIVHHVGKKVLRPEDEGSTTLFLQQLETTRTLHTWRVFDWYYSGLNYHIEHHLFPWVPHWRYRRMRLLVQDFCRRKGFTYREEGFWEAIFNVHRHLARLARLAEAPPELPDPAGRGHG